MGYLTIRNLSDTPLELVLVERFDRGRGGLIGGVSSLIWGSAGRPGSRSGAAPRGRNAMTGVCIGPFETRETTVLAAHPTREILRLTLEATFGDGDAGGGSCASSSSSSSSTSTSGGRIVRRRYAVIVPGPAPHSMELEPVDDCTAANEQSRDAAFSAVYSGRRAHLAVMRRAALDAWMAAVDGTWPLSALSLPGTHNSPACYVSLPSVRCQAVDITAQLEHGVRFFDVRVCVHAQGHQRMSLVHSAFPVSLTGPTWFADLHAAVCGFLEAHPTETVLMSIKREGTGSGTDADLARQLLCGYVGSAPDRWFTEPRIPTLNEVRGRIILVRRFHLPPAEDCEPDLCRGAGGAPGWGIDGSSWPDNCADGACASGHLRLQDFYGVNVVSTIQRKIEYTHAQLERAASQSFPKACAVGDLPPFYMNFLSGSNFFNSSCWPEKIAAKVNPAIAEYLCIRHGEVAKSSTGLMVGDASTGVVITDWVGLNGNWDLIRCVVAWNARMQLRR